MSAVLICKWTLSYYDDDDDDTVYHNSTQLYVFSNAIRNIDKIRNQSIS